MSRQCRKCKAIIPVRIVVDGKVRNLQNRKFCLECSPFGGGNTRKDDPSKKGRGKGKYAEWSDEEKLVHKARVYRKGLLRKELLIEESGGGCKYCGYNKCHRALHFHHTDPLAKKFELNLTNLWSKAWDDIFAEYQKCDLVCANCHAEVEDEKSQHGLYRKIIAERWGDDIK